MWLTRLFQPTFTVSAAAVVLNENSEVLLLDHLLRPNATWGMPGGFLDHGEQPEAAVRREIREETGIELEDVRMISVRTVGRHIETIFVARGVGEPNVLSREIRALGWFGPGELPQHLPQGQRALIEAVVKGKV